MQVETENGETNEVPPLSEVIASVEDVLGEENTLQDSGRGRYPQFRFGGIDDGLIVFLDVDDLSDEEVETLKEETLFQKTDNRSSLQCRVYYEECKRQLDGIPA